MVAIVTSRTKAIGTRPPNFELGIHLNKDDPLAQGLIFWKPFGRHIDNQGLQRIEPATYVGTAPGNNVGQADIAIHHNWSGTQDPISYGDHAPWDIDGTAQGITLCAWVVFKGSTDNTYRIIQNRGTGAAGTQAGYQLAIQISSGTARVANCAVDDGTHAYLLTHATYTDSNWTVNTFQPYLVGMAFQGQAGVAFKDEVENDFTAAVAGDVDSMASGRPLTLGGYDLDPGTGHIFNGGIGDTRMYNRKLSSAERHALYQPSTRWSIYWTPGRRIYFLPTAAGSGSTPFEPPMTRRYIRTGLIQR